MESMGTSQSSFYKVDEGGRGEGGGREGGEGLFGLFYCHRWIILLSLVIINIYRH